MEIKQQRIRFFLIVYFVFAVLPHVSSSDFKIERVEPLNWWAGMKSPELQLMIYGKNISTSDVKLNYPGVEVIAVSKVQNPDYLFVDLKLDQNVQPGRFDLLFEINGEATGSWSYELKEREPGSAERKGFDASDVICLITPDRFVNGDRNNDHVEGMMDMPDRTHRDGRHGGDLMGIIRSLDYLEAMGFTAVWLNPVLENNMLRVSYHGYSTTDFYRVDPRYGSNETYKRLNDELDKRGMKLIMDMIFNHAGLEHWWMDNLPAPDWINNYPEYKITNHRRTVNQDPHVAEADYRAMTDGWFVPSMPDLNQRNPFMKKYLIQNSIWWIEFVGLEGIRQDTWPYPDKEMMAEWVDRVLEEYPHFNVVGEEWSLNPATVSYWQKGQVNHDGYHCPLPSLMDFPLQDAVARGLTEEEGWGSGLIRVYEMLANDFLYPDPHNLVVFPDNHDMSRFFKQVNEDVSLLKMGLAFFLTTRGIPQLYYGTEVLMSHPGDQHGDIRADFPGGWPDDPVNAFTGEGLTAEQKEMQEYVRTILQWRKDKQVMHKGRLKHFVPEKGIYTYFRYNADSAVMVVLNKNNKEQTLSTSRFAEILDGYTSGRDIVSSAVIDDLHTVKIAARTAMIIELE